MIIVSQDKTEIVNFNNVENIWICPYAGSRFTIEAVADTNTTLGEYKTERRAKEVLKSIVAAYQANEIMSIAKDSITQDKIANQFLQKDITPFAYEMPKS